MRMSVSCECRLFTALLVVLAMPHTRSTSSQVTRLARAVERGYLLRKPCGTSFVLVATPVADRVSDIARSLEIHRKHELLVGIHFHHASHAAF